jgi:acyl carrier protein
MSLPIPHDDPTDLLDRRTVAAVVKQVLVSESRVAVDPASIADDEPLVGDLLRVHSLGLLGMLLQLEDELEVTLSDELFVGRSFERVIDVVDVVLEAGRAPA